MKIRIRGKYWNLERPVRLSNNDLGQCDHPETLNKSIRVKKSLKDEVELSTLLHECLHCGVWDLDEEAVDELSDDLARILWRLGYRKQDGA